MFIYASKWFPKRKKDSECLAEALFLENDHWEKQKIVTANAVSLALGGDK